MVIKIDANTNQNQNTLQRIQKAVRRLQQQVDNREREEALRELRLQRDQRGDLDIPRESNSRLSAAPYNLQMSMQEFDSIISSSPASSRVPSMTVSVDPDSSAPFGPDTLSEDFETNRYTRSPVGDTEYQKEERKLLESEEATKAVTYYKDFSLKHSSEIGSSWPLSWPLPRALERNDHDEPDKSRLQPLGDTEKGVDHSEKGLYPASEVASALHLSDSAKDLNPIRNEPQAPQPHPSTPSIQPTTNPIFHGSPNPLCLCNIYERIREPREPRFPVDRKEALSVTDSLHRRVEDWKGLNVERFGMLLLSDILVLSRAHHRNRWHEVYLFERVLLCCYAKELKPILYPLVPQPLGQVPKLQLRGRIFTQDIVSVSDIPNRENSVLRVAWRLDASEMEERFDLTFDDPKTMKVWEEYLDLIRAQCFSRTPPSATSRVQVDDQHMMELSSKIPRSPSWKKRRYAVPALANPQTKEQTTHEHERHESI